MGIDRNFISPVIFNPIHHPRSALSHPSLCSFGENVSSFVPLSYVLQVELGEGQSLPNGLVGRFPLLFYNPTGIQVF